MFEHLGPVPETKIKRYTKNLRLYISFLVLTVLIFTFSFSIGQGPSSVAQEYVKNADIAVQVSSRDLVGHGYVANSDNFELFNFAIKTDRPGITLYKLKFTVNGLYNLELLSDLKLFHQSVQLGDIKDVDAQGNVYFNIDDYVLPRGDNYFSLVLPNHQGVRPGDIVQISLADSLGVTLKYQQHILSARGDFPITSGPISFVEQGTLLAISEINKFFRVAELPQQLFTFQLNNKAEPITVNQLTIAYQSDQDNISLAGRDFVLINNQQVLATAQADEEKIVFDFKKPIFIEGSLAIEMHTLALPVGSYDFKLADWQASGDISNGEIVLADPIALSTIKVDAYFPEFINAGLKNRLSVGWNELYHLTVAARGQDQLDLHKLSWAVDVQGAKFEGAEIWVNNQAYIADVIFTGDKIIVKSGWEKPMVINKRGTDIKLLIKVEDLSKQAKVETYLLSDEQPLGDNEFEANILWAYQDKMYNSYSLPYLPLLPNVLSN